MTAGLGRRIVVVDDEPILRALIADRLNSLGFEARAAGSALEAQKLVISHDPDALIVDLDLGPGPTGIELIVATAAKSPDLSFVLLTNFTPSAWEMKSAKNLVYVKKSDVLEFGFLVEALNVVMAGNPRNQAEYGGITKGITSRLTKRQITVLSLLAQGKSNAEIASELAVSLGSIEQTVKRIYKSLDLKEGEGGSRRVAAAQIYSRNFGPRR